MSAKLMEGLNKLTGGEAANAPYLVAASVGNDVISTAFQKALMKYAPGVLNTLAGVSPALPTYVLPVVPGLATALLASKSKNEKIRKFGQAVGLITLIDVIETVSSMISGPVMSAAGLSGVAFTPMGRRRGMHGVAYTPVGAVPRGLHAVPRGMQGVAFTPVSGLTSRDRADFGRQMADFGGENIRTAAGTVSTKADFGAIPQLRGAHTADAAICENDEDGNPEEGADHMI